MSNCPHVTKPADVAALREWMLEQWRPGEPYYNAAPLHTPRSFRRRSEALRIVDWNVKALEQAQLWFVEADMVALVGASAAELPEVELHPELVPAAPVLCVFERPLIGLDAEWENENVVVHGFLWNTATSSSYDDPEVLQPSIATTILGRVAADADGTPTATLSANGARELRDALDFPAGFEAWLPLGRTDWRQGESWNRLMHETFEPERHASQAEDRRWLTALWMLATQPSVSDVNEHLVSRPDRRRAHRAGWSVPNVRVVSLRHSVREAGEHVPDHGKRQYHVRWPVVGHWRNQAYGPQHSLRRPTWIAPYIAGPEGAPLKEGATVRVLRSN